MQASDRYQFEQAFFVRGPSPFARLIFFSTISLVLMATDARLHYLQATRHHLMRPLEQLQIIANVPSRISLWAQTYFVGHDALLKSNQQYQQKLLLQEADLSRWQAVKDENNHLRNLLSLAQQSSISPKAAEIMNVPRDPFSKKIILSLGEQEQVKLGQAVVDEVGVIGQVTRLYTHSSEVTLVTDTLFTIPVQIERNGLRAIVFGHGQDNLLELPYLPANVDIRKGDRLVTSGLDEVYPMGLGVAVVLMVEQNPNMPFARIFAKPLAGVAQHKQLLILEAPPKPILNLQEPLASDLPAIKPTTPNSTLASPQPALRPASPALPSASSSQGRNR
jgi:rod shape-determining protein MreC